MTKASEIMERFDAVDVDRFFIDFSNMSFEAFETIVIAILGDYERRTTSYQEDIEDVRDALRDAFEELEARALPEGYEWPRYKDGEPVRIGDEFMGKDGKTYTAKQVQFIGKCFSLYDFCDRKPQFSGFYGERVKRPKFLAADSEPLEAGQTVWNVNNGMEFTVIRLPKPGEYQAVEVRYRNGSYTSFDPDQLTHQRPVLDADGVPIKVGDTVYLLPGEWCDRFPCIGFHGGEELEVFDDVEAGHVPGSVQCREKEKNVGIRDTCYPQPSQLTHERPDTWQSLYDDTSGCGDSEPDFKEFVRRCKALAERGE